MTTLIPAGGKKMKNPRRPTIVDVAKAAGVAPSTVSNALGGKGYVDVKTRARILKAAKSLGYRPNRYAQGLRTGGPTAIALVSSMPLGVSGGSSKLGFFMELAAVAAEEAIRHGLALILIPLQIGGKVPAIEVSGTLVVEPMADDPFLESLVEGNQPVVCLGKWTGHDAVPAIDLMSGYTAELLLNHLREEGAKRIAIVIGDTGRTSYVETEEAYRRYCAEAGVQPLVLRLRETGGELAGQIAATELFQSHPEVDGVLALVDAFASGVVQAAEALGRTIPDSVRIATRYDGPRARTANPPLTAVNLHLEEVTRMGVELLNHILHTPNQTPPAMRMPIKPELVVRRSSHA